MDKGNFSKLRTPCTPTKRNLNHETDEIDIEYITPKKCTKKIDTTVQKTKRLQKYKSQWEIDHGVWLTNDPLNEYNGKCKLCGVTFTIASAGIGQVKWWDVRKLATPIETLMLDVTKGEDQLLSKALGASALEYEPTIPTRFMVGTENGIVISGNRKGKTPQEKIGAQYKTHFGPVYAVQRNPAFVKNFLTIGDWTARIWAEDCKESSIIWTSFHRSLLSAGGWSPTRYSVFYTTRVDGSLDAWDILQNQREPCLNVKVCDEPLRCLSCHEYGEIVAVGNDKGTAYLVEFSENLSVLAKNDKSLLTAMFERETRREKIIESKMREIRLRVRTRTDQSTNVAAKPSASSAEDAVLKQLETDFFNTVNEEEKKRAKVLEDETEVEVKDDINADENVVDGTK